MIAKRKPALGFRPLSTRQERRSTLGFSLIVVVPRSRYKPEVVIRNVSSGG